MFIAEAAGNDSTKNIRVWDKAIAPVTAQLLEWILNLLMGIDCQHSSRLKNTV
jgi:hypothetical protein